MTIDAIPPDRLIDYAQVPIAFQVRTIFAVEPIDSGLRGLQLREESVDPYRKDYDQWGAPPSWPEEFDVANWVFHLASEHGKPLGAAATAFNTPGVDMLEGRRDLAVLWDLRVQPERRGQGVGRALVAESVAWARARGCRQLKIETQNVNVPACRFYAACGAVLGEIRCHAYRREPAVAHEVQLIWYLKL